MSEILITFESANYAMQTEAYLKSVGIKLQIMPTPREITLSCGLSIKTPMDNYQKLKEIIDLKKIKIKSLYSLKINENKKIIEKID